MYDILVSDQLSAPHSAVHQPRTTDTATVADFLIFSGNVEAYGASNAVLLEANATGIAVGGSILRIPPQGVFFVLQEAHVFILGTIFSFRSLLTLCVLIGTQSLPLSWASRFAVGLSGECGGDRQLHVAPPSSSSSASVPSAQKLLLSICAYLCFRGSISRSTKSKGSYSRRHSLLLAFSSDLLRVVTRILSLGVSCSALDSNSNLSMAEPSLLLRQAALCGSFGFLGVRGVVGALSGASRSGETGGVSG